jgi:hypothetical protein
MFSNVLHVSASRCARGREPSSSRHCAFTTGTRWSRFRSRRAHCDGSSNPIDPGGGGRGLLRQMNGLTRHRLAENAGLDFSRFSGRQVQAGSARHKGKTGSRSFRAVACGKRYAVSSITALPNAPIGVQPREPQLPAGENFDGRLQFGMKKYREWDGGKSVCQAPLENNGLGQFKFAKPLPDQCTILAAEAVENVPGSQSQRFVAAQISIASTSTNSKKNREFYSVGSITTE